MSRSPEGWGLLAVAVMVTNACFCVTSAQQLHLMQGINHPAGPQFGQPDLILPGAGRNPLDAFVPQEKEQKLLPDAPKDALVDPDGRELKITIRKKPEIRLEQQRQQEQRKQQLVDEKSLKSPEQPPMGLVSQVATSTWLWSLIGCASVVSCGILPAYLLPVESGAALQRAGLWDIHVFFVQSSVYA